MLFFEWHINFIPNLFKNVQKLLPRNFCCLQFLEDLNICCNEMEKTPGKFLLVTNSQVLGETYNKLNSLPENFISMHRLQRIYLWDNKFNTFPRDMC